MELWACNCCTGSGRMALYAKRPRRLDFEMFYSSGRHPSGIAVIRVVVDWVASIAAALQKPLVQGDFEQGTDQDNGRHQSNYLHRRQWKGQDQDGRRGRVDTLDGTKMLTRFQDEVAAAQLFKEGR